MLSQFNGNTVMAAVGAALLGVVVMSGAHIVFNNKKGTHKAIGAFLYAGAFALSTLTIYHGIVSPDLKKMAEDKKRDIAAEKATLATNRQIKLDQQKVTLDDKKALLSENAQDKKDRRVATRKLNGHPKYKSTREGLRKQITLFTTAIANRDIRIETLSTQYQTLTNELTAPLNTVKPNNSANVKDQDIDTLKLAQSGLYDAMTLILILIAALLRQEDRRKEDKQVARLKHVMQRATETLEQLKQSNQTAGQHVSDLNSKNTLALEACEKIITTAQDGSSSYQEIQDGIKQATVTIAQLDQAKGALNGAKKVVANVDQATQNFNDQKQVLLEQMQQHHHQHKNNLNDQAQNINKKLHTLHQTFKNDANEIAQQQEAAVELFKDQISATQNIEHKMFTAQTQTFTELAHRSLDEIKRTASKMSGAITKEKSKIRQEIDNSVRAKIDLKKAITRAVNQSSLIAPVTETAINCDQNQSQSNRSLIAVQSHLRLKLRLTDFFKMLEKREIKASKSGLVTPDIIAKATGIGRPTAKKWQDEAIKNKYLELIDTPRGMSAGYPKTAHKPLDNYEMEYGNLQAVPA